MWFPNYFWALFFEVKKTTTEDKKYITKLRKFMSTFLLWGNVVRTIWLILYLKMETCHIKKNTIFKPKIFQSRYVKITFFFTGNCIAISALFIYSIIIKIQWNITLVLSYNVHIYVNYQYVSFILQIFVCNINFTLCLFDVFLNLRLSLFKFLTYFKNGLTWTACHRNIIL